MISRALTLHSPAKVNLFLEVLDRRPDGYHTLSTLFQEISLFDTLRVRKKPGGGPTLRVWGSSLEADDTNLVLRAARAFKERYPAAPSLAFSLVKRIPLGAGLGGGSSNAAATLRASQILAAPDGVRAEEAELFALAKKLGADVPFFLRGGWASAGGIGDRLTFYPPGPDRLHFVLISPRVFSSTPTVFRALRFPLTKRRSPLRLTRALRDAAPPRLWARWMFNRLEEAVLPRLPSVAEAKRALLQAGCLNAVMSGSGSCVFGVVGNVVEAGRVAVRVKRGGWDVWRVASGSKTDLSVSVRDEVGHHGNYRNPSHASR